MRRDLETLGEDLRTARLASGLTLAQVAHAIGVSPQTILRHERPVFPPGPHPENLSRHAAAVGMRARLKVYPEGAPLRDAASVELMRRFRARLKEGTPIELEVPVSADSRDLRAWDAVVLVGGCRCAVECVTRFHDCQAQLRQFQMKLRDGDVQRLIVVARATHANRRALAALHDLVATLLPLGTRAVLAAVGAGRCPEGNGIAYL